MSSRYNLPSYWGHSLVGYYNQLNSYTICFRPSGAGREKVKYADIGTNNYSISWTGLYSQRIAKRS